MQLSGGMELDKALHELMMKASQPHVVQVGYTAEYAIFVHEDLVQYHSNGEAKYLERPLNELGPEIMRIVIKAINNGMSVDEALLLGGLKLQRESQLLVPVATGNLKSSAYTRLEVNGQ